MSLSPSYRNLVSRPKQSPVELKEKLRKSYKSKIHNCRTMLMDKVRGAFIEQEISNTLTDIYKSMLTFSGETINEEEFEVMEEIKKELIQEELDWLTKEYERSQMENVDWSSLEEDNDVICPVCQRTNLQLINGTVNCTNCKYGILTHNSIADIKQAILTAIDNHNSACNSDVQFGIVSDNVYLLCDNCTDMKLIF